MTQPQAAQQQGQPRLAAAQQPSGQPGLQPPGQYQTPVRQQVPPQQTPGLQPAGAPQTVMPPTVMPPTVMPPAQQQPQPPQAQPGLIPPSQQPPPVQPGRHAAPAGQPPKPSRGAEEMGFDLHKVLQFLVQQGGSDLHLSNGAPPLVRIRGHLAPIPNHPPLNPNTIMSTIYAILTQKQRERFEENLELDFAYAVPGASRFRVNVYRQRESMGAVMRVIPYEIKTLEQLGINPKVSALAALPRGMVLVTGPTGSGKSTTLAALIDLANRTRHDHIMTVEDPIEFLHPNKNCLVNQREVGEDTHSFGAALKSVLRQDPDIILVGELRDLETISVALTAAETGHLVFGTLHTQDAAQTVDRIIDVFPPEQQQQVRVQLAGALQGVVCQALVRSADGKGRVAATEVLFATGAIRNLIREGKTHQIYSSMQAGAQAGMQTMDQCLADLVKQNKVQFDQALEKAHHADDFKRLTGRA
ncbi:MULTISPECIES: PilT/PilU family type 4a pilus ATPase [Kineosporia]|uniref:type IV pilus twitching motility protein PilT n=1 Tax=Kineosporia TaxID=49184 RepID=UPI0022B7E52B|nr:MULTISPECIES: PilT/PilU family type 4a pilus ATPase [Kineosporia]